MCLGGFELSNITKYLNQTCQIDIVASETDEYGDKIVERSVPAKCRKRKDLTEVETNTGRIKRTSDVYILDESENIKVGDYIDGKEIKAISDYVNLQGVRLGYKVLA